MTTYNSDQAFVALKGIVEKHVAPTPTSYDRVAITVNEKSRVLSTYAEELYNSWVAACDFKGYELGFSKEELASYLHALLTLRVDYVNGKRVTIKPTDGVAVPSFFSLVLANIGLARNTDLGLELYPVLENRSDMTEDDILRISRRIKVLASIGLEYAEGYLRSRDGSYDFMTMTLLDESVRNSEKSPHPVYALLASTVGLRGIETVLSPRINYGNESHFSSLMRHLSSVKG